MYVFAMIDLVYVSDVVCLVKITVNIVFEQRFVLKINVLNIHVNKIKKNM